MALNRFFHLLFGRRRRHQFFRAIYSKFQCSTYEWLLKIHERSDFLQIKSLLYKISDPINLIFIIIKIEECGLKFASSFHFVIVCNSFYDFLISWFNSLEHEMFFFKFIIL